MSDLVSELIKNAPLIITAIAASAAAVASFRSANVSKKALEASNLHIQKAYDNEQLSKFENTLFTLLNRQNQITEELYLGGIEVMGRPLLQQIIEGAIRVSFNDIHILDHYFRNLYYMVDFIATSEIAKNKQFYINMIRAQMSIYELIFLFYNCRIKDFEKFKNYVSTYGMLKSLRIEKLPNLPEELTRLNWRNRDADVEKQAKLLLLINRQLIRQGNSDIFDNSVVKSIIGYGINAFKANGEINSLPNVIFKCYELKNME